MKKPAGKWTSPSIALLSSCLLSLVKEDNAIKSGLELPRLQLLNDKASFEFKNLKTLVFFRVVIYHRQEVNGCSHIT